MSKHSSNPDYKELGELLNYNGYGADLTDLHFHPDELMMLCLESNTPEQFMQSPAFAKLKQGFDSDISNADSIVEQDGFFLLPNEAWARRVVGVMAHRINEKAAAPRYCNRQRKHVPNLDARPNRHW